MNNKKAVINQVFVYIMSTIAIIFVGFLVTKFIIAFTADSKGVIEDKFFTGLENDIKQVASRYASEGIINYKLGSEITNVCFVSKPACAASILTFANNLNIEPNEITIISETSNLLIFNKDGISSDKSLTEYNSDVDSGCFCIKPKNNKFKLLIENRKNKVWISELR
jgi:hypothetical protein